MHGQPQGRVSKAILVAAVPPIMVKGDANPDGTPVSVFDGFRTALAANRAEFFLAVASGPFYGFNRPGAKVSQATIENWWRQGMMGSALAHYEGIKAFSETDQAEDLRSIRSEEHTSELQSLMRISYAVFCLKKKTTPATHHI